MLAVQLSVNNNPPS